MVFSTQEFFLFTQELIHFAQETLPLLPKKFEGPLIMRHIERAIIKILQKDHPTLNWRHLTMTYGII